jgi:Zn-finger nucleic acid-binding protein
VLETVLAEMVIEMVPPGSFARLLLFPADKTTAGDGAACPSCGVQMEPVSMYGTVIERCPKKHGVWFDPDELQTALGRASDPEVHVAAMKRAAALAKEEAATAHALQPPPEPLEPMQPFELVFDVQTQGGVFRQYRVKQPIIKIGRHKSCHVPVVDDDRVSRMHAIVEFGPSGPVLLDLGALDGTTVNGNRITKHAVADGDLIVIGATTITVTFA